MKARLSHKNSTHPYLLRQNLPRSSRLLSRGQDRIRKEKWQGAIFFLSRSLEAQPSPLEEPLLRVMIDGCEQASAAQEAIDEAIANGQSIENLPTPRQVYQDAFAKRISEIPPGALA